MSSPQNSFRTPPKAQKQPIRAEKVKNDPNISQNQIPELKETYKMKVVQLHE